MSLFSLNFLFNVLFLCLTIYTMTRISSIIDISIESETKYETNGIK